MTRTRRQLIWFAILGPGLLVLVLVANELDGRWQVRRELALCREAGMQIDPEEPKQPPIPGDQNAASLYLQVFEEIERLSDTQTAAQEKDADLTHYIQIGRSKQTDKIVAAAGRHLARHATVIRLGLEAQSKSYCRYEELSLPSFSGRVALAGLLVSRVTYLYHTKGPEAAWQALAQSLKAEHAWGKGAGVMDVVMRTLVVHSVLQPLRQMIEEDALPTDVAAEELIRRLPSRRRLTRQARNGLSGEIGQTEEWFDEVRQPKYFIFPLFDNQHKAADFATLRMAYENADRPFAEVRSLPWPPRRWYHVHYLGASSIWSLSGKWHLHELGDLLWFLPQINETYVEADLMHIGLLLEAHRRRHGDYPQTLETLRMPDGSLLPTDPFDGKAYRYRKEQGGYCLWSVGENCVDDGGISSDETWQFEDHDPDDYDIVLWVGPKARASRHEDRQENDASLVEDDEEDEEEQEEELQGPEEEPAGEQAVEPAQL